MRQICLLAVVATVAGCINRDLAEVKPNPVVEEQVDFPFNQNNNLDLLFVVDNSGSMRAEQVSLAINFVNIINTLEAYLPDGLPNIHVGVVSTDMGDGPYRGCTETGDQGRLQNTARVAGCSPPTGAFISNVEGVTNYSGSLADTFACIAQLGTTGCGFEQPLESMQRALDGSNPSNAGFLRDDAMLAIVFITDEDDCSVKDTAMFDDTNDPNSTLGARTSFRCFEFGVTCDVANARSLGPREVCKPREDSPYMTNVNSYISFVKSLKPYNSMIMVAAIVGTPTPIAVTTDGDGYPCLAYSCGDAEICGQARDDEPAAVPPIRLKAFIDAFSLNQITTICDTDLSDALQKIAEFFVSGLVNGCLKGTPKDLDPATPGVQADCAVTETRTPNTGAPVETVISACDNASDPLSSSRLPCYTLLPDTATCPGTDTHLSVTVHYPETAIVPPDTRISARCATN